MQRWKPKPSYGIWIALALLILVLAGIGVVGTRMVQVFALPPEQWTINSTLYGQMVAFFVLIGVALFLIYRIASVVTLFYEVDRNGIYIYWLGNRAIVPIEDIVLIDSGDAKIRLNWGFLQSIASYWGLGYTSEGQQLHLFSTLPPVKSLCVHTSKASFALSPKDKDSFIQHLEQCRRLGSIKPIQHVCEFGRFISYAFWNDHVVRWALVLACILNLVLLGLLMNTYPSLADVVRMRFDAAGEVTEFHPRHQVLFLPLASFLLILLNTAFGIALYRRMPEGARLLQISSVLMPVLFGLAAFSIIVAS